jgi:outer membrane protein OmpA-like peptidoglycan-associated protein
MSTSRCLLLALTGWVPPAAAQKPALSLPPVAGTSVVQTLTFPEGDRESVHTVTGVTPKGLRWMWQLVETHTNGDTLRQSFYYAELNQDLASAIRLRAFHDVRAPEEHPGYTMHALSRDVYRRLRTAGSDSFQVMALEPAEGSGMLAAFGIGTGRGSPVRWSGRLSVATPAPVPFPLLVNGRRVELPALHVRGRFTARGKTWESQFWFLADSAYPLMVKWIGSATQTGNVLQTIRVDLPSGDLPRELELGLEGACRVELPGIYFAFNSAVLDSASNRTIAAVAGVLAKHPDWTVTLEGHTDSIGSAASNRILSERRVAAVRARLVDRHQVDAARLKMAGLGSARPRESNATIEGRARNRRVELVRECAGR